MKKITLLGLMVLSIMTSTATWAASAAGYWDFYIDNNQGYSKSLGISEIVGPSGGIELFGGGVTISPGQIAHAFKANVNSNGLLDRTILYLAGSDSCAIHIQGTAKEYDNKVIYNSTVEYTMSGKINCSGPKYLGEGGTYTIFINPPI